MDIIQINQKISYIEASGDPLSADIGIIRDDDRIWLYDVGDREDHITGLTGKYHIVLSHFHKDHVGNLPKLQAEELFVSRETQKHIKGGTLIDECFSSGNIRIFPIPSSHARGCLGLEVDHTYAFVGDALYCKSRAGRYVYNVQFLKEEIAVLKSLDAPFLLVSHYKGLIRPKEDVIRELEEIFSHRSPFSAEVPV